MGTKYETIDSGEDENLLATLSERQQHQLQMQEIKRRTVAPNVMKLDVDQVVSAENSPQWAIDLNHPAHAEDDTLRFFVEKPMHGWSRDYSIVKMMDWYGVRSQDPHQFEFMDLYVEKDEERSDYAHGWCLIQPPDYDAPIKTQLARHWRSVSVSRPIRTSVKMYGFLFAGAMASLYSTLLVSGMGRSASLAMGAVVFMFATLIGMIVLQPEEVDD